MTCKNCHKEIEPIQANLDDLRRIVCDDCYLNDPPKAAVDAISGDLVMALEDELGEQQGNE